MILATLALVACGGRRQAQAIPDDPIGAVAVAPLPVGSLAGSSALLMTVGTVVVGDSVPELNARRSSLLEAANAALDTALRRDAREVTWQGLPEQRRAMRRNPALGIDPDRMPTSYLLGSRISVVPDPLWSGMRTLAGMTGARYAVVPVAVRLAGRPGAVMASYVLVAADTRTGQVVWRGRTDGGPAATAEAALAMAAGAAVPSPIPQLRP